MPSDWKRAIRASGHTVSGNEIRVRLAGEREHRVVVTESDDCLVFTARVAGPSAVRALDDALLRAWLRNRGTKLVGFRLDARGWLIGEAWAPRVGLEDDEVRVYAQTVAAECDRFEFQLTGRDME